ncbi:hypothetical protein BDZ94DRAFT_1258568 [Collybia nuda]|uniref:Uncharacterized protein n=1 Tax=Collybia nuda TaxID=64659 RepID=A0A9P6CF15_9AGAR|nr:hypothetical protein BDZ94DRAFT_1258568 [Collybia nuda]
MNGDIPRLRGGQWTPGPYLFGKKINEKKNGRLYVGLTGCWYSVCLVYVCLNRMY